MRRFITAPLVFVATALAGFAAAPEPLNLPVPLSAVRLEASAGDSALSLASAQRAQALGFTSAAAEIYRSMLDQPGADRPRLTLALASTLLDAGDVATAHRILDAAPEPHESPWHLREGLVAAYEQRYDGARAELADTRQGDLPPADQGWYLFLKAVLADARKDGARDPAPDRAENFYKQAIAAAVSTMQRARFVLGEEQTRLRLGGLDAALLEAARRNYEAYQGQVLGYSFARDYAVALNAAGRSAQAVAVLLNQLRLLPSREKDEIDHTRLLLGMIDRTEVGREALYQLVAGGSDAERQRIALQILAQDSATDGARAEFRHWLDTLIDPKRSHPILENFLLTRAQMALADKNYQRAEDDAHALLERFPGSSLKANALALLASSAWEQRRYRTAAEFAQQARAIQPEGRRHGDFGVLIAEAWYRAEDFRNAADAYAAALHDPPSGVPPGILMFQRVQAEIQAAVVARERDPQQAAPPDGFKLAASVLDEMERNPAFDPEEHWQAEWNLAREMERSRETAEAYQRVNRLLAGPVPATIPGELRGRMAWLQARLSYDARRPEETVRLADGISGVLEGLSPNLRTEIAGQVALLRAEADFELQKEKAGLDALDQLRVDFKGTEPAEQSYLVEADHYARLDRVVDAQQLYTKMAEDAPKSRYAPYALYQAAIQAERLGQKKNLEEAERLLDAVASRPWEGDAKKAAEGLCFAARMRQGDLLRELNQFPQAEEAYQSLVDDKRFAQDPDVILARLALAECRNAQSANDPAEAKRAEDLLQDLVDREDAPPDVRVEAGYNLGALLSQEGDGAKAQQVWWRDVVDAFLVKPGSDARLGAKGRWWMAQTLLQVANHYQVDGRLEEARGAWQLVVRYGLPGSALARERLASFNLPVGPR